MRLRRLRGLTQEQLAERMGTRQPAIARIERGNGNMRLSTLVALAEALETTVRVDLEPVELLQHEAPHPRWWDRPDPLDAALAFRDSSALSINVRVVKVGSTIATHPQLPAPLTAVASTSKAVRAMAPAAREP
jgi:transcriptional regulator with XRE-family HTH domain